MRTAAGGGVTLVELVIAVFIIGILAAIGLNRARLLDELTENDLGTLQALARAVDIGKELGFPAHEIDLLHRGGLLHNIGKIGIPGSILDKPGRLTDAEVALMQEHPAAGARILGPIPNLQKVVPLVGQHHERFDGKGYPNGLSDDAISLHARILSVADVFDALSADRPCRSA